MGLPFKKTAEQVKLEELQEQIKQNAADNAYIAMMCDIDFGEEEEDSDETE